MPKAHISNMAKDLSKPEPPEPYVSKIKATHNLSSTALAALEIGQSNLRTMLDPKIRGKLNRSLIVELIVKAAMADFTAHGERSQLYRDTVKYFAGNTD